MYEYSCEVKRVVDGDSIDCVLTHLSRGLATGMRRLGDFWQNSFLAIQSKTKKLF